MLVFTAGLFHNCEELSDDKMVAGIYLFHRRISHNAKLRKELADVFSNNILSLLIGALGNII